MTLLLALLCVGLLAAPAQALPLLQLYIEGAEYVKEDGKEGWVLKAPVDASAPTSIRLWAIGQVSKWDDGDKPIEDVRLATAYDKSFGELDFRFGGARTQHPDFWSGDLADEPMTEPDEPELITSSFDPDGPDVPTLSDGSDLPNHGVYKSDDIAWQEFGLADFDATDWHMANFDETFDFDDPDIEQAHMGQIKVYEIAVFPDPDLGKTGASEFHFDLYNSKAAGNSPNTKAWFAPFSHDAEGDVSVVPAPSATVAGLAGALILLSIRGRRREPEPPLGSA